MPPSTAQATPPPAPAHEPAVPPPPPGADREEPEFYNEPDLPQEVKEDPLPEL